MWKTIVYIEHIENLLDINLKNSKMYRPFDRNTDTV